jgi:hypothetical protein
MIKRIILFTLTALLCVGMFSSSYQSASAESLDSGNVINDGIFNASGSMSASSIDTWLNGFAGSCISPNSGFRAPAVTGYSPNTGYTYGGLTTAGVVISTAAQVYGINPQVQLVRQQSEQGLVRGDGTYGCGALAMSAAMGYRCAESNGLTSYTIDSKNGAPPSMGGGAFGTTTVQSCVSKLSAVGFSAQVILGSWQLTFDEHRSEGQNNWYVNIPGCDNSDDLGFCYTNRVPNTNGRKIYLCPNNQGTFAAYGGQYSIDGQTITIQNGATAAMYNYTPHVQTRFYNLFTGWFGSTQGVGEILNNSLATNTLTPGTTINAGDYIVSPNGRFVTTMQYDGNLVTYAGSRPVWSTGTAGNYGNYAIFQNDGNFVVYNAGGGPLWWSTTWGMSADNLKLQDDGNLHIYAATTEKFTTDNRVNSHARHNVGTQIASETRLNAGDYFKSPDGRYTLIMQDDGNLVLYSADGAPIWNSGTAGRPGSYAVMQNDGNLVVYTANNTPIWWSGTWGQGASTLKLQNDGNLVVYRNSDNGVTWATWSYANNYQVNTYIGTEISSGTTLHAGEYLRSPDWRYTLVMQEDGNLVVYSVDRYTPIWNARTWNNGGAYATVQNDGNFVVYNSGGGPLWNTYTYTQGSSVLKMQSDGNLVLYRSSGGWATWNSFGF